MGTWYSSLLSHRRNPGIPPSQASVFWVLTLACPLMLGCDHVTYLSQWSVVKRVGHHFGVEAFNFQGLTLQLALLPCFVLGGCTFWEWGLYWLRW